MVNNWSIGSLLQFLVFILIFAAIVGLIFTGLDDAANATGADPSFASLNTITKLLIGLIPVSIILGGGIALRRRRGR